MLFLGTLFILLHLALCNLSPIVEIEQGRLRGVEKTDWEGGKFYSFLSVPYAKQPLGDLRFKDPQPPENWDGIYEANIDMPMCTQFDWKKNIVGQENCLFLNIHTPELETTNPKPVMLFIHGGAYVEGNGRYEMFGPEFLISEGVLLVTIQYRLGLFGFLNFNNPDVGAPGNAGLKDQNFALRWVQKNIAKFGGNPDSVTIFGESAGGASVHQHLLSPLSKGLFHKVISQSGTALNNWNGGLKNTGIFAAKVLNYKYEDEKSVLKHLQDVPMEEIMKVQSNCSLMIPIHEPYLVGPVVEPQHSGDVFLSETPMQIISKNNFNKVPFMLGYNNREELVIEVLQMKQFGKLETFPKEMLIPHTLGIEIDTDKQKVLEEIIQEYNLVNYEAGDDIYNELIAALWINYNVYQSAVMHSNAGHKDLYFYKFSADTKLNYMKLMTEQTAKIKGATHIDELGYLFKNLFTPKDLTVDSTEGKCIEKIVKLWTNFAKFGNPTPERDELNIEWPAVTQDQLNYLEFDTNSLSAKVNPLEHVRFWESLYERYAKTKISHEEL